MRVIASDRVWTVVTTEQMTSDRNHRFDRLASGEGGHCETELRAREWIGCGRDAARSVQVKRAFGLDVPETLAELCVPERTAILIYDMQAGIVPQIGGSARIVEGCGRVVDAAREGGFRIFFTRHFFLPNRLAGAGQLRRAMVWQKKGEPAETRPLITMGSPGWQLVPELVPREDEGVVDKIAMSAFEGTYLGIAMRDAQLQAFVIAGIALEVGIEPTVRHALDLNFIPIVVPELCGSKTEASHERSMATLRETGEVRETSLDELLPLLRGSASGSASGRA